MSVNKVILVGNLVHDPRIVEFQNGGKNAQFALATNKKVVNNENNSTTEYVEYHNIVIPSKGLATIAEQYLKKGDKVQLVGFGTFEVRERAARTGHNPKTNESIQIAASRVPAFKAGKAFKEAVAKK